MRVVPLTIDQRLFSPSGIALSILRQPVGSSDLTGVPPGLYNYQPTPQSAFSLAPDLPCVAPMLRAALAVNPDIRIIATPWSRTGLIFL